ncbi:hypothetical protein [Azohydromonas caseinilytica]|uniref:Uncharacterized protein n=1 Tax=Azohydromonas caseinilytica TaxID=2728836 RepID=A0A848FFN0_9BURK|nr:hypothetical protein [Azohydromonas caseinilytica]NML16701.1 hypothetical protein [Azohydromonas caseinilytica]
MAAHDSGSTTNRHELLEANMSITRKLACMLTLGLCAGLALTGETWTRDGEEEAAAQVAQSGAAQAYVPPMQSFWVLLAMASAR